MNQVFNIIAKLPSLNDLISATNHNKFAGAALKRRTEDTIVKWLMTGRARPVCNYPVVIKFTFYEPDFRRDQDNVESGRKYILDALQKRGIIENDNHKHVSDIPTTTVYDKTVGGHQVRVEIIEP